MAVLSKSKFFNSPALNSRVKSANTQASEIWLGYCLGPSMLAITYYCIAGTYLTQFYTDVLGLAGGFLTMMPIISKVVDALTNVLMGRIIDKTRTKHGKARPWVLISGVLITVTGILLYSVPTSSYQVQLVWIVVSYNLFFAFAYTIYNMSHALMVPLSTRNTKQRDTLAVVQSAGVNMIPGILTSVIMPILIAKVGVGHEALGSWMTFMSILSIFALPATIIEYYFTKERVTEDQMAAGQFTEEDTVPFSKQIKACFTDKYWIIIFTLIAIYWVFNTLQTNSMLYYCNWVVSSSVEEGAANQVIVNMIGQAPLGLGILLLWPLIRKFGKRVVMQAGCCLGAIGCTIIMLSKGAMGPVMAGLVIKSFGGIPLTYALVAMLADALDHIEWKYGYRSDGFSAAVQSIIATVTAGLAQTIIIGGISSHGYIVPESAAQIITQPDTVKNFFTWTFAGAPLIGYIIGAILMIWYNVEKFIPQISSDITDRYRAAAEARGEVYYSPAEKAAMEQEENERKAEENRIAELKAKCARKGLSFEEEEAKYQAKLAEKKAKAEAKAAKKKKK